MLRPLSGACVVLLLAVGCSSGAAKGPSASVASPSTTDRPTTTTAKALTPEQEVEAAYLKSWDVYAKAMRNLDPSGLERFYAGEQLQRTSADVRSHRERNVAVRVRVDHGYVVEVVAPDLAIVRDKYRNHSVLVDPITGDPKEPDPNEVLLETYTMKELDGRWKVVDIVREQSPS